jgi:carboxyl-terminal processing protease
MIGLFFACCLSISQNNNQKNSEEESFDNTMYNWLRTFAEVLQLAKQKHYKVANLEEAMIKAMDAFLNTLDPHSNLLDKKTYQSMIEATSGEFFGIGIVIDNTRKPKDKFLIVVDTIPDGPADKSGVKPFDKIIEIDGAALEGMSTQEATAKLKGERNTKVHVKILRENQPDLLPFDITRDVIKEQNALSFYIPSYNIYYLSLSMFSENAAKQIASVLEQANKHNYKGLIIDLRNNSGGLLNAAIDIAGLFLPKGSPVVITKDKHNAIVEAYKTKREPLANNTLPIFVLINNYTASAAEILAGSLQVHSEIQSEEKNKKTPLVFLVGSKTFGKGSVQEVIPISNNVAVSLTSWLYFLATSPGQEVAIQGIGIEPDFTIERMLPLTEQIQWFTKYYGRENNLQNYIKLENTTAAAATTKAAEEPKKSRLLERAQEMLKTDNQLRETIALINLFDSFKKLCPEQVCSRKKAVAFMKQHYLTNHQIDLKEIKG